MTAPNYSPKKYILQDGVALISLKFLINNC